MKNDIPSYRPSCIVSGSDASERIAELEAEVERLQAVVARLPKTADGVRVWLGDVVYWPSIGTLILSDEITGVMEGEADAPRLGLFLKLRKHVGKFAGRVYSTREAAEAAKGGAE